MRKSFHKVPLGKAAGGLLKSPYSLFDLIYHPVSVHIPERRLEK